MDIGLDMAMFNNQLEFTFDWYKSTSEDLLYRIAVPTNAGATNGDVVMNAATMENSGLEFLLSYRNRKYAVKYDITANLSTLNNKVTQLGVSNTPRNDAFTRTEVGREVGSFYGYVYEGIFQSQEEIDTRIYVMVWLPYRTDPVTLQAGPHGNSVVWRMLTRRGPGPQRHIRLDRW